MKRQLWINRGIKYRNPERIDLILDVIKYLWKTCYDWRFLQFIHNTFLCNEYAQKCPMFNIEDDYIIKDLYHLIKYAPFKTEEQQKLLERLNEWEECV